ncbi:hypothetical protein [Corynebacterium mayonis]|uniref:hypothetical protein n=1 Tax=Corynebacterium mayonis TaxID=3062461 RepID=UPI00314081BB
MDFSFPARAVQRLKWADVVAQAQRNPPRETDRATVVAVAAFDDQILSSPVSAIIGVVMNAVAQQPVAVVDADGVNQPMRSLLGAGPDGDMVGLVQSPAEHMSRRQVEHYVDQNGLVPVLSTWTDGPGTITPEVLDTAVNRVSHRWPSVVVDLPFTCPAETITAGTALAKHVVLVTDRHHQDHRWLYRPGHHLYDLASQGRVTVAMYGARANEQLPADACALPWLDVSSTARERIRLPLDPESLTLYQRLLSRIYP